MFTLDDVRNAIDNQAMFYSGSRNAYLYYKYYLWNSAADDGLVTWEQASKERKAVKAEILSEQKLTYPSNLLLWSRKNGEIDFQVLLDSFYEHFITTKKIPANVEIDVPQGPHKELRTWSIEPVKAVLDPFPQEPVEGVYFEYR